MILKIQKAQKSTPKTQKRRHVHEQLTRAPGVWTLDSGLWAVLYCNVLYCIVLYCTVLMTISTKFLAQAFCNPCNPCSSSPPPRSSHLQLWVGWGGYCTVDVGSCAEYALLFCHITHPLGFVYFGGSLMVK